MANYIINPTDPPFKSGIYYFGEKEENKVNPMPYSDGSCCEEQGEGWTADKGGKFELGGVAIGVR